MNQCKKTGQQHPQGGGHSDGNDPPEQLDLDVAEPLPQQHPSGRKWKFGICFFGVIARSIEHTIDSIQKNIFNVLTESNIDFDIFVHNMYVNNITANRSDEINLPINNDLCKLLTVNANTFKETKQSKFDKQFNWKLCRNSTKSTEYNTFQNAIREIYSVKMVTSLWNKIGNNTKKYDLILYIRPDLLYVNKLDIDILLKNIHNDNVIFSPSWHKHKGLNDRIYMGSEKVMNIIGNRIDDIEEIIKDNHDKYHAEICMKYIVDKHKFQVVEINLKGKRVRANGQICPLDLNIK
jgi:hypothetical protein